MKKKIIVCLILLASPAKAGWITTYMAYSAANDAEQARRNTENTAQQVQSVQKQLNDLNALVLKMAQALDDMQKKRCVTPKKKVQKVTEKK